MTTIYSNLKLFDFPEQLNALKEHKVVAPVHVRIKPINACNHNCWFCAYRADGLELGNQMNLRDKIPFEKLLQISDDLIVMGVKAVTFSGGGEPLIYPKIAEIIRKLHKGGIHIGTLTNGAYLKGDVAQTFAECATWVRVSMDGWDAKSYSEGRGVSDKEFDKVCTNIKNFAALKSKCALGVSFIVSQRNASHVFEYCQKMKALGVQSAKIAGCIVSNDGKENNKYHAPIRDIVRDELQKCKTLENKNFTIVNHYHETDERFDKPYERCPFLQFLTVIGADCKVYTCQDKAYTDSGLLGSIVDRSFKDFWCSDENKKAMENLNPKISCTHHCVSHRKNLLLTEYLDLDPEHALFV